MLGEKVPTLVLWLKVLALVALIVVLALFAAEMTYDLAKKAGVKPSSCPATGPPISKLPDQNLAATD